MRFSASAIKEFQQCGLKFRYHRIDRLPTEEEASHHRWFGRLVHDLVYTGLAERVGDKNYTLLDKPRKRYATSLLTSIWDGKPKDETGEAIALLAGEKPKEFSPGKIKSLQGTQEEIERGWKKQARSMISNGIDAMFGKTIEEIEVSLEWEYLGENFIGYLDFVGEEDGRICFYDLKTSWQKPSKIDFQFFIYSYALKTLRGLDYYPSGYWVHLKDGTLRKFEVDEELVKQQEKDVGKVLSYISNGVFPSIYGSPLCKFCDFYKLCYGESSEN